MAELILFGECLRGVTAGTTAEPHECPSMHAGTVYGRSCRLPLPRFAHGISSAFTSAAAWLSTASSDGFSLSGRSQSWCTGVAVVSEAPEPRLSAFGTSRWPLLGAPGLFLLGVISKSGKLFESTSLTGSPAASGQQHVVDLSIIGGKHGGGSTSGMGIIMSLSRSLTDTVSLGVSGIAPLPDVGRRLS